MQWECPKRRFFVYSLPPAAGENIRFNSSEWTFPFAIFLLTTCKTWCKILYNLQLNRKKAVTKTAGNFPLQRAGGRCEPERWFPRPLQKGCAHPFRAGNPKSIGLRLHPKTTASRQRFCEAVSWRKKARGRRRTSCTSRTCNAFPTENDRFLTVLLRGGFAVEKGAGPQAYFLYVKDLQRVFNRKRPQRRVGISRGCCVSA